MRAAGIGLVMLMAAATAGDTGAAGGKPGKGTSRRKVTGRQTGGQAAVADLAKLDAGIEEIVELVKLHKQAGERLSESVKELAKDAGFLASVVRSLAVAKSRQKVGEKKREVGQMALAFGVDAPVAVAPVAESTPPSNTLN